MSEMSKRKEPSAITVRFKPSIRMDGEITWVTVSQDGQKITMTREQALSLIGQIQERAFPPFKQDNRSA